MLFGAARDTIRWLQVFLGSFKSELHVQTQSSIDLKKIKIKFTVWFEASEPVLQVL